MSVLRSAMNTILYYVKAVFKVRWSVNALLMSAVFYLVLYHSVLLYKREIFTGAAKLGAVWGQLCLAVIASYVFYFLVVHIVRLRDHDNISGYVADKVNVIVRVGRATFSRLIVKTDVQNNQWPSSMKQIEEICSKITLGDESTLLMNEYVTGATQKYYATWMECFVALISENKDAIRSIFVHNIFLDSELIKLLGSIDNCSFFEKIEEFKYENTKKRSCEVIAGDLENYFKWIDDLEMYATNHLNHYRFKEEHKK